jgi:hypothetical protein
MKKKTKSIPEPIGEYRVIKDFLPSPEKLVFKEEKVKVTKAMGKVGA